MDAKFGPLKEWRLEFPHATAAATGAGAKKGACDAGLLGGFVSSCGAEASCASGVGVWQTDCCLCWLPSFQGTCDDAVGFENICFGACLWEIERACIDWFLMTKRVNNASDGDSDSMNEFPSSQVSRRERRGPWCCCGLRLRCTSACALPPPTAPPGPSWMSSWICAHR